MLETHLLPNTVTILGLHEQQVQSYMYTLIPFMFFSSFLAMHKSPDTCCNPRYTCKESPLFQSKMGFENMSLCFTGKCLSSIIMLKTPDFQKLPVNMINDTFDTSKILQRKKTHNGLLEWFITSQDFRDMNEIYTHLYPGLDR